MSSKGGKTESTHNFSMTTDNVMSMGFIWIKFFYYYFDKIGSSN